MFRAKVQKRAFGCPLTAKFGLGLFIPMYSVVATRKWGAISGTLWVIEILSLRLLFSYHWPGFSDSIDSWHTFSHIPLERVTTNG